jgi:hypothetical protein
LDQLVDLGPGNDQRRTHVHRVRGGEANFGLSPAARARLASDPPPKHGKFDGLIGPLPGRGA